MKTMHVFRKTMARASAVAALVVMTMSIESCQRKEIYQATAAPGVKVPQAVQTYLSALGRNDLSAQRAAFAPTAVITDDIGSCADEAALRQWLAHHNAIHSHVKVLEAIPTDSGHTLRMQWVPEQPESSWEAYYTFVYEDDKIARLYIRSERPE